MTAKPKAPMMRAMRARRKAAGTEEVRGIWLPRPLHLSVKRFASGLRNSA